LTDKDVINIKKKRIQRILKQKNKKNKIKKKKKTYGKCNKKKFLVMDIIRCLDIEKLGKTMK